MQISQIALSNNKPPKEYSLDVILEYGPIGFSLGPLIIEPTEKSHEPKRLRENLRGCDYPFAVSLACGAVKYSPENDLSFAQLLKLADGEMYKDKR